MTTATLTRPTKPTAPTTPATSTQPPEPEVAPTGWWPVPEFPLVAHEVGEFSEIRLCVRGVRPDGYTADQDGPSYDDLIERLRSGLITTPAFHDVQRREYELNEALHRGIKATEAIEAAQKRNASPDEIELARARLHIAEADAAKLRPGLAAARQHLLHGDVRALATRVVEQALTPGERSTPEQILARLLALPGVAQLLDQLVESSRLDSVATAEAQSAQVRQLMRHAEANLESWAWAAPSPPPA